MIGQRLICTAPLGPLVKDRVYTVVDITRIGRVWRVELENLPDSFWDTKRFVEARS